MKSSNPNYHVLAGEIAMKTVTLEIQRMRYQYQIDPRFLQSVRPELIIGEAAQQMVLEMTAAVASRKYAVKTARFPADWWQAVKLRFMKPQYRLSRWFLKKHPVIYTEVTLEASAYYPEIHIDGQQAFVKIVQSARNSAMPY